MQSLPYFSIFRDFQETHVHMKAKGLGGISCMPDTIPGTLCCTGDQRPWLYFLYPFNRATVPIWTYMQAAPAEHPCREAGHIKIGWDSASP